MNCIRVLAAVLAVTAAGAGCRPTAAVAPVPEVDARHGHLLHAQTKLPTVKVWVGAEVLTAEIARQPVEVATGMMFRTNLAENEAMIFVFPSPGPKSFYMRNCVINLAGAYLNPAGEIRQILEMKRLDETPIPSVTDDIQFVLELPEGWFARHGISTGAVVRTEHGSLRETFFGTP